jgi:uncharacterized membrane protein
VDSADRTASAPFYQVELRPNCALTPRRARLFFASIAIPCFAVAGYFTARGFWPVLPFAGLEIVVLGAALVWTLRRSRMLERVTITEQEVCIEVTDGALAERVVFPRHWSRVTLRAPHSALHPSRLLIESRGREFEVGGFLTEDERRALAVRLRRVIGNINSSPPLAEAIAGAETVQAPRAGSGS